MTGTDALAELESLARRGVSWGQYSGPLTTVGSGSIPAAVLLLFGQGAGSVVDPDDLDLLFLERASTLREHPGQVAFPGGRIDMGDRDPAAAALREAQEETAVDPAGVRVLGELSPVPLPVSDYRVVPVLGWWEEPSPVHPVDLAESARVFRVPVSELIAPENRANAQLNRGGRTVMGPAFKVAGTVIWGFTGIILADLLGELGWAVPWDVEATVEVRP